MSKYKSDMTTIRTEVYEMLINNYIDYLQETLEINKRDLEKGGTYSFLYEQAIDECIQEIDKYHEEKEDLYAPISY